MARLYEGAQQGDQPEARAQSKDPQEILRSIQHAVLQAIVQLMV